MTEDPLNGVQLSCPCGLVLVGDPAEVRRAYDQHDCVYHDADRYDWPRLLGFIAMLVFLSFICTNGWGLMK
jgi:hypothetical protein